MKAIVHKANTRGYFDHGWLQTAHTFSFADYYDPERVHFGALRVLNDDRIAPGTGFAFRSGAGSNTATAWAMCRFCTKARSRS